MKLNLQIFLVIFSIATSAGKENNLRKNTDESDRNLGASNFSSETATNQNPVVTRFVVKYKSHEAMVSSKAKRSKQSNSITPVGLDAYDIDIVNISSRKDFQEFEADDNVLYIEPDEPRYLLNTIPSELKLQGEEIPYGINLVKALGVSDEFVANQKVCIVDTGFDISHPDLPSGGNVSGNDNSGYEWKKDGNGHGSHVAGTIAGIGGNGIGVVGVNRNGAIGLHIERVFNDNGNWIWASTIIKAVSNCVAAGSNIISMSLGGPFSMNSERDLFESLLKDSNVLIIAAAGNAGSNAYSYPASYPSVMSVAAIDSSKRICSFSQRNDQVDISAPGLNVLSVKSGGGYVSYSGTSMATPHVSGVAALVWSHFPNKSAMEIRDALMFSAEDLGSQGRDDSFGYGLVQADKAYEWIKEGYTLSPTVAPTPELPCFDFGNYVNGRGKDCEWFTRGIFNYRCFLYGDSRPNNDGVTPNEACCVCGGGTTGGSSSPTKSPTMSPTASPTACVDEDNWLNSRGKGCEWYGYWRCLWYGGKLENEGLVANEACCVCK